MNETNETNEKETRKKTEKKPYLTPDALTQYLIEHENYIIFNDVTRQAEIGGFERENPEYLQRNLPSLLYSELQGEFEHCTIPIIAAYLDIISSRYHYNPAMEMIVEYPWDGIDRLPELYSILGLPEEDTLSRTLIRRWLVQCISMLDNSLDAAFGADGVLVLTGPQGIGKTTFFRRVAVHPDFFKEGVTVDFRNKDTCIKATSCWICELGEIESTFRSDMEGLKAFITQSKDEIRRPYAREAYPVPRRTSLCGTCNSADFLVDTSGNRRFWTVPVTHIDLKALREYPMEKLWRQVFYIRQKEGRQSFRLTPEEQKALAQRNVHHEKKLAAQDELEDILSDSDTPWYRVVMTPRTVTEFKEDHECLRKYTAAQIGKALDKLGIEAEHMRINGKFSRVRMLPKREYYQHQHS